MEMHDAPRDPNVSNLFTELSWQADAVELLIADVKSQSCNAFK